MKVQRRAQFLVWVVAGFPEGFLAKIFPSPPNKLCIPKNDLVSVLGEEGR